MKNEGLSLEEQVERIRRKRTRHFDNGKVRIVLNTLFLILAIIGLTMYFFMGDNHIPGLIVIAAGMMFKVVEFILRLL